MEMFLRHTAAGIVAFGFTLFVVRLVGKKEVSQLTFFDLVSAIALGTLSAEVAGHFERPTWLSLWLVLLWGLLTIGASWVAIRSRVARGVLQGKPTIVVQNGKVLERSMAAERYNLDILLSQLRGKGIFNLADVEFAMLEPDGKLSVLPKSQQQPLTPADLKIPTEYEGLAKELVMDGRIMETNLEELGLTRQWLMGELRKQGITAVSEVFHAQLATNGSLYVDRIHDGVGRENDPSDL
ncbi:MAG: DUF421 domain-containing protein [Mycobacterium leprae]